MYKRIFEKKNKVFQNHFLR